VQEAIDKYQINDVTAAEAGNTEGSGWSAPSQSLISLPKLDNFTSRILLVTWQWRRK
jgi:predicted chitinase